MRRLLVLATLMVGLVLPMSASAAYLKPYTLRTTAVKFVTNTAAPAVTDSVATVHVAGCSKTSNTSGVCGFLIVADDVRCAGIVRVTLSGGYLRSRVIKAKCVVPTPPVTTEPTPPVTEPTTPPVTDPVTPTAPAPPYGATALCNDGTYSYALHHQGSCSYHGGVAVFYS